MSRNNDNNHSNDYGHRFKRLFNLLILEKINPLKFFKLINKPASNKLKSKVQNTDMIQTKDAFTSNLWIKKQCKNKTRILC